MIVTPETTVAELMAAHATHAVGAETRFELPAIRPCPALPLAYETPTLVTFAMRTYSGRTRKKVHHAD